MTAAASGGPRSGDSGPQIRATRRREEKTESEGCRSEFRYGSFMRSLPLPAGVDPEAVTASDRDGIPEVRVPRPPERPST